jgi:hypothetical protein
MHDINDITQPSGVLKRQKIDQKPPESGRAKLHESREKIIAEKYHRKHDRPRNMLTL